MTLKTRCSIIVAALVLFINVAHAQTPAPVAPTGKAFEVASIKVSPPMDPMKMAQQMQQGIMPHIGMNIDAARVDIGYLSLSDIVGAAFKVKRYQITGPDWMPSQRFDILGKIPEGGTKDQVPEMLQTLLVERFKMTFHHESKDQNVFELTVGKGGPKLKESEPDPEPSPDAPAGGAPKTSIKTEGNGVVVSGAPGTGGTQRVQMMPNGMLHIEASKMTMSQFADTLTQFVGRPVVDKTGLTGNYQVVLELSMEDIRAVAASAGMAIPGMPGAPAAAGVPTASDPSSGAMFTAVQNLGLKLDGKKGPMDMIVIDRIEKLPTEN